MITKFLDPTNDKAFKRIFASEKNKDILIHFLNDIFGRTTNPIEDVTFLKTNQEAEIAALRESIVDVMCVDLEGNHFIVEIQVNSEPGFEKRAQYYASKTYIQQREKGIEYKDLKEVTFLAILSHCIFPEKPDYLSRHETLDTKTQERNLKDFSFCFLELPKFKKTKDDLKTMTEKWAYFFKHAPDTTKEDLKKIIGDDRIMERAYYELDRYSWTPEEIRDYDGADMKRAADKAIQEKMFSDGKAEGKAEGIAQEKKEIALKMLKRNRPIEEIIEDTGLSIAEIQELKDF